MLCEYGCGQEAKHQLKSGKWVCSTHHMKCPNGKKRNVQSMNGHKKSKPEIFFNLTNKICEYGCGQEAKYILKNNKVCCSSHYKKCLKYRQQQREKFTGKNNPMTCCTKEKNHFYGKKHNLESLIKMSINNAAKRPEVKKKMSESAKGKILKESTKQKLRESTKKLFLNENYLKNYQKGCHTKPNKTEQYLSTILSNFNYEFVGDYQLWIGGKNPDFINRDKNKIIEFFGWRHEEKATGIPNHIHENSRIEHFDKYGYKTLIIWNIDLKNEETLIQKIMEFNNK